MLKLKLIGILTSLFLILIIFFRLPEENVGLASFTTKSNVLGSARSARYFLNILTGIAIVIYLGIAIVLDLTNTL